MPRKYILITIVVLLALVLGFIFMRGNNAFSGLSALNLDSIFSRESTNVGEGTENTDDIGYTLQAPSDFVVTHREEDGIELAVYERAVPSEASAQEGFQIFVIPFDEEGPITPERILLDVDIEINNPKYISLDGVQALAFNSADEGFGTTFEVWVIQRGKLYQVMTYGSFETKLLEILTNWRFK